MQTANAKTLLVTKLDTKLGGSGAGGGGRGRPRNWRSAKVAGAGIGFPALLDLCLQQRWHLAYVWSAFAAVDTRFYTKLNGRGGRGGGGGRPRHRLSAKIASIDSIIANLKNDKRVQAKSSVVGADSKRKGNARLIVAELEGLGFRGLGFRVYRNC